METQSTYALKLDQAIARRAETLGQLGDVLDFGLSQLTAAELAIASRLPQINHPARHCADRGYRASWGKVAGDPALGPARLVWSIQGADGRFRVTRKMSARTIAARSLPEFAAYQRADYKAVAELHEVREVLRGSFAKVARAIGVRHPDWEPDNGTTSSMEWWQRSREGLRALIHDAVIGQRDRLADIDQDLLKLMTHFNRLAYRRAGSLMVRFELDGRGIERVIGPRGPAFFLTFHNPTGKNRRIRRLRATRKSSSSPISSSLLRKCHYSQHVTEMRALAVEIQQLKERRLVATDQLRLIASAAKPLFNIGDIT